MPSHRVLFARLLAAALLLFAPLATVRGQGFMPKGNIAPNIGKLPPTSGLPSPQRGMFRQLKEGPVLSVVDVRFDSNSIWRTREQCSSRRGTAFFRCRFRVTVAVRNTGNRAVGRFAVEFDPLRSGFETERARRRIPRLGPGERAEVEFPVELRTNRPGQRCVSAHIKEAHRAVVLTTSKQACIEVPDMRVRDIVVDVEQVVVHSDGDNITDGEWYMWVGIELARGGRKVIAEDQWDHVWNVSTGDRFDPRLSLEATDIYPGEDIVVRAVIVDCDGGPFASVNRLAGVDCAGKEDLLEQSGDADIATGSLIIPALAVNYSQRMQLRVRESGASDPLDATLRLRVAPAPGWPDR